MSVKRQRAPKSRPGAGTSSSQAVIRQVIQLEKRVWKAAQQRDAAEFSKLVPEDAVMIFRSGIVRQPDYLKTMASRTIERYELRGIRGFLPNPTTAILLYRAVRLGSQGGRAFPAEPVVECTTWIRRRGRWVAILNQETPIAPAPAPLARARRAARSRR
jgi:hypothetical protein